MFASNTAAARAKRHAEMTWDDSCLEGRCRPTKYVRCFTTTTRNEAQWEKRCFDQTGTAEHSFPVIVIMQCPSEIFTFIFTDERFFFGDRRRIFHV